MIRQFERDKGLRGQNGKRLKGQRAKGLINLLSFLPFYTLTLLLFYLFTFLPLSLFSQDAQFHIVVKGDTLWHIAVQYLANPLRWKEIWNLNKQTIPNPDLIFPEQKIVLAKQQAEKVDPDLTQEEKAAIQEKEEEKESPASALAKELPPEPTALAELSPSPTFEIQLKKESQTILTNLSSEIKQKSQSKNRVGRILANPDKILFEKGDWIMLKFDLAKPFSPQSLFLVSRWREALLTPEGEIEEENKILETIGVVELVENLTPTKSIAKVIEISDPLEAGDLLEEFPD